MDRQRAAGSSKRAVAGERMIFLNSDVVAWARRRRNLGMSFASAVRERPLSKPSALTNLVVAAGLVAMAMIGAGCTTARNGGIRAGVGGSDGGAGSGGGAGGGAGLRVDAGA